MIGALIILAAMVVIGIILYVTDRLYYRKKHPEVVETASPETDMTTEKESQPQPSEEEVKADTNPTSVPTANPMDEPEVCCGAHTVCEKTNLSPLTGEIVYYDDEELDRYRGRAADDYTQEEIEEFRDVLMTLLPQDVAGWSRSIQVREINLPTEIREELIMIVSYLRR